MHRSWRGDYRHSSIGWFARPHTDAFFTGENRIATEHGGRAARCTNTSLCGGAAVSDHRSKEAIMSQARLVHARAATSRLWFRDRVRDYVPRSRTRHRPPAAPRPRLLSRVDVSVVLRRAAFAQLLLQPECVLRDCACAVGGRCRPTRSTATGAAAPPRPDQCRRARLQ